MNVKALCLAGVASSLLAAPAMAHHSFAMFNVDKTLEMTGTVQDFQWTNPHSWLDIMVMDENGKPTKWALEMGAPGGLARQGWRPKTVVAGDKITVKIHPLKDGTPGGQLISVVLPDGRTLGKERQRGGATKE